jgi:GTPase
MAFVDECTVFVQAGRGGDGSASLRSEPYKPRAGPDGGDGGRGGSVVFEVSRGVHDLSWLAEHRHQRAENGGPGRSGRRHGAAGKDLVILVPDGTVIGVDEGLLADLVGEGTRAVVARGGRGGRGNAELAGPKDRAPRVAEPGEAGEERRLGLELRLVADVGLVGLPNAGKSTLLARLTAAKPRIADYPFTTLSPNIGVASVGDDRYVVADVPGLIEGAHEGRGLGDRFLRHIARCPAIALIVDLSAADPTGDLRTLREELRAYDAAIAERPSRVVATKADLVGDPIDRARALGRDVQIVSGITGDGVDGLRAALRSLSRDGASRLPPREPYVVVRPGRPRFTVTRDAMGRFEVKGRNVERWVAETDLDDDREVARLQQRLKKEGVDRRLRALGARPGDEVQIRDRVFEFVPDRGDDEEPNGGEA